MIGYHTARAAVADAHRNGLLLGLKFGGALLIIQGVTLIAFFWEIMQ